MRNTHRKKGLREGIMLEDQSFEWNVTLPDTSRDSYDGYRRKTACARVDFSSNHGSETFFFVPTAVAKRLIKRKKEGLFLSSIEELNACIDEFEHTLIRDTIAWYINKRDYSSSELSHKLRDKGYKESIVAQGISWAISIGLIDDTRVADSFIRSKLQQGWGARKISYELTHKGIDPHTLAGWPEAYISRGDELERARALAEKKLRIPSKDPYVKIVRALVSKGFSSSIAYQIAREVTSHESD